MANGKSDKSFWQLFRCGQNYMRSWPAEKKLAVIFPELRTIKATRFAIRVMPPFAVFTLSWQIALHGLLPVAIVTALFACSLPLQGLWWLGKRSITPLPDSLSHWFFQLRDKLLAMDVALAPIEPPITYQSLADLLNLAFKRLDGDFLDEL